MSMFIYLIAILAAFLILGGITAGIVLLIVLLCRKKH